MAIERLTSAEEFLSRTHLLRSSDVFRTNILGSVATAVADGALSYDDYFWWVAIDRQGEVIGAAMRTAPHGMILSPMPNQAISELARAVAIHDDEMPSVSGPVRVVKKFLEEYEMTASEGSGRKSNLTEELLIYALEKLTMPEVTGDMAAALADDFDLILEWYVNFRQDTGVFMPHPENSIQAGMKRDSYRFWVRSGQKVSLAGHAPLVQTSTGSIVRIGPVYTPPEQRGNGYASAVTAALSKELLDKGSKVMLYTDAKNPTSNSIYQKIGFKMIDQNALFTFSVENV